jgi:hypothetical protein
MVGCAPSAPVRAARWALVLSSVVCCRLSALWVVVGSASAGAAHTDEAAATDFLKGTTWRWNSWRIVKFECDGSFSAPTPECEGGGCTWSGAGDAIRIDCGDAGRHTLRRRGGASAGPAGRGARLEGQRDRDGDACTAVWVKNEDCPADWYEVLGVAAEASARDIKKRYKKLAMELHPDKPGGDAERFAQVCTARPPAHAHTQGLPSRHRSVLAARVTSTLSLLTPPP